MIEAPTEVESMALPKASPTAADHDPSIGREADGRSRRDSWERLIENDPNRPGPDRVVLAQTGIPVWAIVGYLQSLTGTDVHEATDSEAIRRAAADYAIDEALVRAAVAYYIDHRQVIDAKLARNAAAISGG